MNLGATRFLHGPDSHRLAHTPGVPPRQQFALDREFRVARMNVVGIFYTPSNMVCQAGNVLFMFGMCLFLSPWLSEFGYQVSRKLSKNFTLSHVGPPVVPTDIL